MHELTTKNQEFEIKLETSQQNVNELRSQLDISRADVSRYQQTISKCETENIDLRRHRDNSISERDSLQSTLENRIAEIERLKCDIKELENQLKSAINAKYEAIAKYDEIEAKEANLEYKERRMEQDRSILEQQLQSLTESYNSNLEELLSLRRERQLNRIDLETKLSEKEQELNIITKNVQDLTETKQSLLAQLEEITAKRKDEADEAVKMMDCYKNELLAKTKLADVYKIENQNANEHVAKLNEGIAEIRRLLDVSVKEYGELETAKKSMEVQHEQQLEEKQSIIDNLKTELKHANALLQEAQEESRDKVLERIAPSAAASSKLIKSKMTLTEIYTLYVKTAEELRKKERDNANLQHQLNEIVKEIEERAPEIDQRNIEYDKLTDANVQLQEQLENLISERVIHREELEDALSKLRYHEREHHKLQDRCRDLSRQVCYLLADIERSRGGLLDKPDTSINADMSANEVISKKLVTFGSIDELQQQNEKLLLLVRDLTGRLEELEEIQSSIDQASFEARIADYTKRLEHMETQQQHQTQLISSYIQQRDRFKLLYYEIMKDVGKPLPTSDNGSESMEGVDDEATLATNNGNCSVTPGTPAQNAVNSKQFSELEQQVKDLTTQLQFIKEEYQHYRKEKLDNEKILNEHINSMRTEVRELTSMNCKLKNNYEFTTEQIKVQEKNAVSLKKQISTLEERNRVYDKTNSMNEQTISYLREQMTNCQKQLSTAEVKLDNLRQECKLLQERENRLQMERESLHRERHSQNIVLNNLELIKCQFERSESEGKLRLEKRLDETSRECNALRRHLQEEQDRHRQMSADLERQTKLAQQLAQDEKVTAEKLQTELQEIRVEVAEKSKLIESLSVKLQEALTPNKADNPIAKANKKAKELQVKLDLTTNELEHVKKEWEISQTNIEHYCKIAKDAEIQANDANDLLNEYKTKTNEELQKVRANEAELQARVTELETEIKLQITDAQLATNDSTGQLSQTQHDLKEALKKISENNTALRDLREQCNILTADLKTANDKYTKAMQLHTADLNEFNVCKEKLSKLQVQIEQLTVERDQAKSALDEVKNGYDSTRLILIKEKEELEKRFIDLDAQNTALHNQLQTLSNTLSVRNTLLNKSTPDESMNDSTIADSSIINRSINEDDGRDQLLQIIKYLRKEKDIAVARVDVLHAENTRIAREMDSLKGTYLYIL